MIDHCVVRIVFRLPAGGFVNGGQIIQTLIFGRCPGLQITQHILETAFGNLKREHV